MDRPRRIKGQIVKSVVLLIVLGWLVLIIAIISTGRRDEARSSQAIIVLGAAQYDGHPSPVLKARLDHAISLWQRGLAPLLLFTGGKGMGDTTSEAAVSRRYAIARGVPAGVIEVEENGMTTSQSMHTVAAFVRTHPRQEVILVSDPFHMLRLSIIAERLGLVPYTSPTRTSPISSNPDEQWRYIFSESMKVPLAFILERGR